MWRPATRTTRCRTRSHPERTAALQRRDGLGRPRAVGGYPARGPHVLLKAGPVSGHRDQRRLDRLLGHERLALRRSMAPAGLAAYRARGAAHRVLALEHPSVRRRDVLGRRASRTAARDRADRQELRRPAATSLRPNPTTTSRCYTTPTASSHCRRRDRSGVTPSSTPTPTGTSSRPSPAASSMRRGSSGSPGRSTCCRREAVRTTPPRWLRAIPC